MAQWLRPFERFAFPYLYRHRQNRIEASNALHVLLPLWTRQPEQSDVVWRFLFERRLLAFASAQYIRMNGAPATFDDHQVSAYSGEPARHLEAVTWLETAGSKDDDRRKTAFIVNNVVAVKFAIKAGRGIGILPDYTTEEASDLVPVLTKNRATSYAVVFCLS